MVGVPTFLDRRVLIWVPTLASIGPVVHQLERRHRPDGQELRRPQELHSSCSPPYPLFWPAVAHNLIWLLFFVCVATPLGIFFAVLLDRELRGTRIYQSVFYLPVVLSLVIVGFIWELQYAPTTASSTASWAGPAQ